MFSSDERLGRQRLNLTQFVASHETQFALMRYSPWTVGDTQPRASAVRIAPSQQLNGYLGVFPSEAKVRHAGWIVAFYPGVLMWSELLDQFDSLYHCPTAIEVEQLNYTVDAAQAQAMSIGADSNGEFVVRMMLVGDPTHCGSILNSPRGLDLKPNCVLASPPQKEVRLYLRPSKHDPSKQTVDCCLVHIELAPGASLKERITEIELLVAYDASDESPTTPKSIFWSNHNQKYCEYCFSRESTDSNRLESLSGGAFRHAKCDQSTASVTPVRSPPARSARLRLRSFTPSPYQPLCRPRQPTPMVVQPKLQASPYQPLNQFRRPAPMSSQTLASRLDQSTRATSVMSFRSYAPDPTRPLSLAAPSSDSSSDESDADTAIDLQSTCSRRTDCSRLSLSLSNKPPIRMVESAISDSGRKHIRAVWSEFESALNKKAALTYVIPLKLHDTDKEAKRVQKLLKHYDALRAHCGQTSTLLTRGSTALWLDSPHAFLRARLEWQQRYRFDRKIIKTAIIDLLQSRGTPSTQLMHWQGLSLCDSCLQCAVGICRTTFFGVTKPDGPTVTVPAPKALLKRDIVRDGLRELVEREGQFLPTAEGKGKSGNCEHRVLPYQTTVQTLDAVQRLFNSTHGEGQFTVSASTFGRAVESLEKDHSITINMGTSKTLAKCRHCTTHMSEMKAANESNDATRIKMARKQFDEHNDEWQRQRAYFDSRKALALAEPWSVMTITSDGMDQQKTQLPHRFRGSKSAHAENLLKMRFVGAFAFGGPIPCFGFSAAPNVRTKGANASVGIHEQILDLEYCSMDTNRWAPIPGFEFDLGRVDPSRIVDADSMMASPAPQLVSPAPRLNPTESQVWAGSAGAAAVKPAFMWPEGAHFTFDNTAADSKNTSTFRFFGQLVAAGVFNYITVSTLMVGHTHDIVDQMFSVWSRQLDTQNAHTLSAMHALFESKYQSKIYELSKLEKQLESKAAASAAASVASLDDDDNGDVDSTFSMSSRIADRCAEVARTYGIRPRMVEQTLVPDVDSWWPKPNHKLTNITKPHHFYIVKEKKVDSDVESVVMYTKFLVNSHLDTEVRAAAYTNVRFGPWTSRITLLDDATQFLRTDPFACHPVSVMTSDVRLCLDDHRAEGNMTDSELDEFSAWLDRIDAEYKVLETKCVDCADIGRQLAEIGPITSNTHKLKEAEKALAKAKTEKKTKLIKQRDLHLADSNFRALHTQSIGSNRWWTKWLERVRDVIRPYYLARKLIAAPTPEQLLVTGRQPHPVALPSDPDAEPLRQTRVDVDWQKRHGAPRVDDWILVRSSNPQYPVWVGKVIECGWADEGDGLPGVDAEESKSDEYQPPAAAAAAAAFATDSPAPASAARRSTRQKRKQAPLDDGRGVDESGSEFEAESDNSSDSDEDGLADADIDEDDIPFDQKFADVDTTAAAAATVSKRPTKSRTPAPKRQRKTTPVMSSGKSTRKRATSSRHDAGQCLIQWAGFEERGAKEIDPNDSPESRRLWQKFAAQHGVGVRQHWQKCVAAYDAGLVCPLPLPLFVRWRDIGFLIDTTLAPESMSRASCIMWGPKIMVKKRAAGVFGFAQATWDKLLIDICESNRPPNIDSEVLAEAPPHVQAHACRTLSILSDLSSRHRDSGDR